MTSRREFIKRVSLAASGARMVLPAVAGTVQNRPSNLGIITGTLKNEIKEGYKVTLKALYQIQ
jgi:hypothetical protein